MRILVINNHGQFNHLIRRAIRDKVDTDLISNLTEPERIDADGLILGGGPTLERAGRCEDYLNELKIPILGICLGMQLMTRRSEEGILDGFGWIDAETVRFRDLAPGMKVPHMGWNRIAPARRHPILEGLGENPRFYFVHSYFVRCASRGDCLATTAYGPEFDSAIVRDHVIGVQFHPEKSHKFGMRLLKNFADL